MLFRECFLEGHPRKKQPSFEGGPICFVLIPRVAIPLGILLWTWGFVSTNHGGAAYSIHDHIGGGAQNRIRSPTWLAPCWLPGFKLKPSNKCTLHNQTHPHVTRCCHGPGKQRLQVAPNPIPNI